MPQIHGYVQQEPWNANAIRQQAGRLLFFIFWFRKQDMQYRRSGGGGGEWPTLLCTAKHLNQSTTGAALQNSRSRV